MSYIVIDKNRCKGCYLCVDECPKKLLKVGESVNSLGVKQVEFSDPDNACLGCAKCAKRCPDMAIVEVYRG